MKKILPFPLLTLSILCMWLLLNGLSVGQFLLGLVIGVVVGPIMARLQPQKIKIKFNFKNCKIILTLFFRVLIDIVTSNIAVIKIILKGGPREGQSGFMILPLDLKNQTGLAVLSCILTSTPGTALIAYQESSNEFILHVLDLHNEDDWKNLIKTRYESALLEIFND